MPKNPAIDEVPKAPGSIVLVSCSTAKDVNYGYDAQKGEFTDLVPAGIIDPTKVARHALQDRRRWRAC
jgi:chaperonin GroEL